MASSAPVPPPSAGTATSSPEDATLPEAECDIVLQGGTASGVVYPRALARLAERYRLRGIGGTSAGAMAAAVAAAAEYGRSTGRGGFDVFTAIPRELGGGRLMALFQPTGRTRPLLELLLAITGGDRPEGRTGFGRISGAASAVLRGYFGPAILGLLPGLAVIVVGAIWGGVWAVLLGVLLLIIGVVVALCVAVVGGLTRAVPQNSFGICSGLAGPGAAPALTDWLSAKINTAAGLPAHGVPLSFGQLWTAEPPAASDPTPGGGPGDRAISDALANPRRRRIDLRVITTCLSESRPYELPFSSTRFFYDRTEWQALFPSEVLDALDAAPEPRTPAGTDPRSWRAERDHAGRHSPPLRRLPDAEHLPVVVAARMSLSLPLVISAVPLWLITRTGRAPQERPDPAAPPTFVKVWFSDGGLATNFPVQLFDAALPSRPTYAINLQSFPPGTEPDPEDPAAGVQWAHDNRDGLAPTIVRWPERGLGAVTGFLGAMYNSSRTWQDNTQLGFPGFRDRIVRVLQTPREGGVNLAMDDATIERLARRGEYAVTAIMDQFEQPHYPPQVDGHPSSTGWDNHRWVRYRALLSVLPGWAASYGRGRRMLGDLPEQPPSYPFGSEPERRLAAELDEGMSRLAAIVADADPDALAALTSRPRPVGVVRRIPQI